MPLGLDLDDLMKVLFGLAVIVAGLVQAIAKASGEKKSRAGRKDAPRPVAPWFEEQPLSRAPREHSPAPPPPPRPAPAATREPRPARPPRKRVVSEHGLRHPSRLDRTAALRSQKTAARAAHAPARRLPSLAGRPLIDLNSPEALRRAIVSLEVLGPPRALVPWTERR